jgi:hypothetical protein
MAATLDNFGRVLLPERVISGRYCLWSCTQEALAGVLSVRWGIDVERQDLLRFLDLTRIQEAVVYRRDPGAVGGADLAELSTLYALRWSYAPAELDGAALGQLLVEHGPHLARWERGRLPARHRAGAHNGPHVVLVVGVEGQRLLYSDFSWPHQPGELSIDAMREALLPAPHLPDQRPFLAAVTYATEMHEEAYARLVRNFRADAVRSMCQPAQVVYSALNVVVDAAASGTRPDAENVAALLNGVACSARAAGRFFGEEGHDELSCFYREHAEQLDRLRTTIQLANLRRTRADQGLLHQHADFVGEHWARGRSGLLELKPEPDTDEVKG